MSEQRIFNRAIPQSYGNPLTTPIKSGVISWVGTDILTINADTTKFDITEITIGFVDRSDMDPNNHVSLTKTFQAQTVVSATFLNSDVGTWVGYDSSGTIVQSVTEFTPIQRNDIVQIGRLGHFDKTNITGVFDLVWIFENDHDWAREIAGFGSIKVDGAVITSNGTNLKVDRSLGNFIRIGAGIPRNIKNYPQSPADTAISFIPAWANGGNNAVLGTLTTDLDPTHYDNMSGILQDVGNNQFTNNYLFHFPYKSIVTTFLLFGDSDYASLADAKESVHLNELNIPIGIEGGISIAAISMKKETIDLSAAITGGTAYITVLR